MGCIGQANNARCDNEVNYMLPLCQATSGNRCLQPRGTKRSPMVLQIVPKRILPLLSVCSPWQQPACASSPASEGAGGRSEPGWWPHLSHLQSWPHMLTQTRAEVQIVGAAIFEGWGGGCCRLSHDHMTRSPVHYRQMDLLNRDLLKKILSASKPINARH